MIATSCECPRAEKEGNKRGCVSRTKGLVLWQGKVRAEGGKSVQVHESAGGSGGRSQDFGLSDSARLQVKRAEGVSRDPQKREWALLREMEVRRVECRSCALSLLPHLSDVFIQHQREERSWSCSVSSLILSVCCFSEVVPADPVILPNTHQS